MIKFSKYNPYTIQNIKLWCKLNNKPFELISDKYQGSTNNLIWKCLKCDRIFNRSWDYILQELCCTYCNSLAIKNPELASEWHPTKNGILTAYDVSFCSGKHVWWKCKKCNHEWIVTIADRHNMHSGCPKCKKLDVSGENHWNWKGGITPIHNYLRSSLLKWKRDSMKNCNYKCIITGDRFEDIHHLYSFSNILFESLNELNFQLYKDINNYTITELKILEKKVLEVHYRYPLGVCITNNIHKLFHLIYGRVNNTPEQWEEFVSKKLYQEVINN